jgi:hypothetical protein
MLLIRGLDAEDQLRPLDAVVPFGRRARLASRWLPAGLRGPAGIVDPSDRPAETLRLIESARPGAG